MSDNPVVQPEPVLEPVSLQTEELAQPSNEPEKRIPVKFGFTVVVLEDGEIKFIPLGQSGWVEMNGLAKFSLLKTEEGIRAIVGNGLSSDQKLDEIHTIITRLSAPVTPNVKR